jgi:dephospho-CoA kinase
MSKILVTGMSGTGKSTALAVLGERGHRVVDTDTDEWCEWVRLDDGSADWMWRENAIGALLRDHRRGHLFVAGCKSNQGKFYAAFDEVVLLSAPAEVILARVAARTNNPYGKRPEERDLISRYVAEVEPRLRATATHVIDASAPLAAVVRALEAMANRHDSPSDG